MSPVELAKLAGVRPQVIYNLMRQNYIQASKKEVVITRYDISDEVAQKYLEKRATRLANKS